MGGKSSTSTQQVSVPPEVLQRYNSVNNTAQNVAGTPFTPYSTDPNAFVAPMTDTQNAGVANTNATAGSTTPYYNAAVNAAGSSNAVSQPYYGAATDQISSGLAAGQQGTQQALGTLAQGNAASQPYISTAGSTYGNAYTAAQPFNAAGQSLYTSGLNQGAGGLAGANNTLQGAATQAQNPLNQAQYSVLNGQSATQPYISSASQGINDALTATQGYNNTAGALYGAGLAGASPFMGAAGNDINKATDYINPFNSAATQYATQGAQAVNPDQLDTQRYLSPYLNTVLQGTAGLLNQNNQQQQAGQLGSAIRSGAFGGDRAGVAAANLAQQQNLANASIYSGILNQGYNQALGTAQQQQGVTLGAGQANRAAVQNASNQMLGIGAQGFGQNLAASQQSQALGQGIAGLATQAGQNFAGLGNQQYTQQMGASGANAALANQIYGMGAQTAQIQGGLAGQQYSMGANTAAQQAANANSLYGINASTGQGVANIGNQIYTQGMGLGQAQQGIGSQLFSQGAQTAQQQAQAAQQQYSQGLGAAAANAGLGGQLYGQGSNLAALYGQLGSGAQAAALQSAQAQLGAGSLQQQTQQAGNTALYNQFLQQQSYPFQTAQFLANIAEGTGSLSGSTTTTTQPGGFFSDRRLKDDVKKVGKTFDGQDIVTFRYKGEPETQMGLIAQDVEKKHPEAVGLAGGFKTVDYGKATEDAASRAHRASGGVAGRAGFDAGGIVMPGYDPNLMSEILRGQQTSLGGGAPGLGGSIPGGGSSRVPQANLPVHQLQTAGPLPQQPSPLDQMNGVATLGKNLGDVGHMFGKGDGYDKKGVNDAIDWSQGLAQGGVAGYATGGVIAGDANMPYKDEQQGPDLNIPDQVQDYKLATAPGGSLAAPESGLGQAGKAAGAVGGILKAGKSILSIFSDERLKENIKPIGKTFDGQTVYSYNFKGDHRTQIGLLAQEVEKKHPEVVGESHGYKTVDYARAVKRKKKAAGGALEDSNGDTVPDEWLNPYGLDDSLPKSAESESKLPVSAPKASAPAKTQSGSALAGGTPPIAKALALTGAAKDVSSVSAPNGSLAKIASWIAAAEGTGRNPKSSAVGPFQFLNGTFKQYAAKMYPDLASKIKGMSDSELTAFRASNPDVAQLEKNMGLQLTADNAALLKKNGYDPNAGNLYLAHFLGPKGALNVLGADPGTPASKVVDPKAMAANSSIMSGKTVGDVVNWANSLMAKKAKVSRANGGRTGYDGGGDVLMDDERKKRELQAAFDATLGTTQKSLPEGAPAPGLAPAAAPDAIAQPAQSIADAPPASGLAPVTSPAPTPDAIAPAAQSIADMAPPPSAPTPPAGLAPSPAPRTSSSAGNNYLSGTEDHSFGNDLKHGRASALLPILSGLAAMGTAPTRSLGVALAAGLGAGVNSYQGQRQYQLDRQKEAQVLGLGGVRAANETMQVQTGLIGPALQNFENMYEWRPTAIDPQTGKPDGAFIDKINGGGLVGKSQYAAARSRFLSGLLGQMHPGTGGVDFSKVIPGAETGALGVSNSAPTFPANGAGAPAAQPSLDGGATATNTLPVGATDRRETPVAPASSKYGVDSFMTQAKMPDDSALPQDQRYSYWANMKVAATNAGNGELAQRAQSQMDGLTSGTVIPTDAKGNPFYGYQTYGVQRQQAQKAAADGTVQAQAALDEAAKFPEIYNGFSQSLDMLSQAYQQAHIESGSGAWARAIGNMAANPILRDVIGDKLNEYKDYTSQAQQQNALVGLYQTLTSHIGARAQGTELNLMDKANDGGHTVSPAATYANIIKLKALMDLRNDQLKDLSARGGPQNVAQYAKYVSDWYADPRHSIDKYLAQEVQKTPFFKGMKQDELGLYAKMLPAYNDNHAYAPGQRVVFPNGRVGVAAPGGKFRLDVGD